MTGHGLRARLLGLSVAACFGAPAQAIVINDIAGLAAAQTLASAFDSVAEIIFTNTSGSFLCSGSLISATAVLTADHCARGFSASQVTVNFTTSAGATQFSRSVSAVHTFGDPSTGANLLNGSDLAILTLGASVTTRLPFMLYDGTVVGSLGRFVGYGATGVGSAGATGAAGGARRAAENVIDFHGVAKTCGGPVGCNFAGTTNILTTDFDNPSGTSNTLSGAIVGSSAFMTTYEGSPAGGDSGGPILVLHNDVWLIAGVTSGGGFRDGQAPSSYGTLGYFTSVASPAARGFVETYNGMYWTEVEPEPEPGPDLDPPAVVPVPAGGPLLLAALAGFAALRRRAA